MWSLQIKPFWRTFVRLGSPIRREDDARWVDALAFVLAIFRGGPLTSQFRLERSQWPCSSSTYNGEDLANRASEFSLSSRSSTDPHPSLPLDTTPVPDTP